MTGGALPTVAAECDVCRVRLKRGTVGTVCVGCGVRVHHACSDLTRHQRERGDEWTCRRCRNRGQAVEEEARAESVDERGEGARAEDETEAEAARPDATAPAGEDDVARCMVCRVRMRRGVKGVECVGCGISVHKKCCGLNRWQLEKKVEYVCGACLGVAERGEAVGIDEVLPAGKCDVCGRHRRRGQGIRCKCCGKVLHVACAELGSRYRAGRVDRNVWECKECVSQERADAAVEAGVQVPIRDGARGGGDGLTVMQWNCDRLSSCIADLEVWLAANDVDVALLQETKLRAEDGEVKVRGYEVVRKDRCRVGRSRWSRGGGLVTLVRTGWMYRRLACGLPGDDVVEALSVEVVSPGGTVWRVMNLYVPPEGVVEEVGVSGMLDRLRAGGEERWIVGGDLNAHNGAWDSKVRADARGEEVLSWADDRGLFVLNDGCVTRVARGVGTESSPDVTLCSEALIDCLEWSVRRELGSDHFPILISHKSDVSSHESEMELVWNWKEARWDEYADEVRLKLKRVDWESLKVKEFERRFRNVVLSAAWKCVGKKKRKVVGELVSSAVREEMSKRDVLKGEEVIDWEAVKNVEEKIKAMVSEEKASQWRSLIERGASVGEMWPVVNGVGRRMGPKKRSGEVMEDDGKVLVTAREKANGFVRMHAKVSRVNVPKDRRMKSSVNALLRGFGPEREEAGQIQLEEVRRALDEMDGGRAGGPDGIHPRLLKKLPEEALAVVCMLFERSLRDVNVPQVWRVGEIVPLLKAGKDPSKFGSYRPVCLTSCMGKWLERVIGARMRWVLESAGYFSRFQAGFREGRGVNDQLVRLTQSIWDAYQKREKVSLLLYDFERAFDRVWRDGLLLKLIEAGVARPIVRWVQEWLKYRLAWVKMDGVRSKEKMFAQGLPQGSVLSPLLFLVFINDLVEELSGGVEVSAFADDLAVWHVGKSVAAGREKLQWATDVVARWSEKWLLRVNVEKCSVTLFSRDVREREMSGLDVRWKDVVLRKEKLPCFLGITFDINLTFREQVDKVCLRAKAAVRLLRRLAGRDWGWSKELLRVSCLALVRAVLLYGSAAWGPWLSKTVWERLERAQLEAARVVGGTCKSAPKEAVLAEAGLCELRRVAEGLWMSELERCRRAEDGDPRRDWGLKEVRQRLVSKEGWRKTSSTLLGELVPGEVGRMAKVLGEKPWGVWKNVKWLIEGEKSADVDVNRREAMERLGRGGGADVVVYTDGSAKEGLWCGGASAVITRGDPTCPEEVDVRRRAAGLLCSSYQAEIYALEEAMLWLREHVDEWGSAMVVSDSQAGLRALKGAGYKRLGEGLAKVARIGRELGDRGKQLTFAWVPGHCGVPGNEWADREANAACTLEQGGVECMFEAVKCLWKRREVLGEMSHERCRRVYGEGMRWELEKGWNRKQSVSMARFRSGHSLELGGYRKRIGMEGSGFCRRCGEDVLESVEHVMECDAGLLKRDELGLMSLSDLCCRPRQALEYWEWWKRVHLKD